ncbi:MAG: hypothetical protein AB7G17_05375 [Phycisphaerales bacterium]
MRTAEAMRRTGGDPSEGEWTEALGSACVGARVLSLARAACAVHMSERARALSSVGVARPREEAEALR